MNNKHYSPEQFWASVNKTEGCWNWSGRTTSGGYGRLSDNGRPVSAHRYSYELEHGPIPDGMTIDHRCHNRLCVKPSHLRAATYKQNAENRGNLRQNTSSGVRGVTWHARGQKWQGSLMHNYKRIHVGLFATVAEAEAAVTAKRNELFTHNDADRMATK